MKLKVEKIIIIIPQEKLLNKNYNLLFRRTTISIIISTTSPRITGRGQLLHKRPWYDLTSFSTFSFLFYNFFTIKTAFAFFAVNR